MTESFEKQDQERESGLEIPEPFFTYEGKIAFIGRRGLRLECEPEKFKEVKTEAELLFKELPPTIIITKIRQLLGDEMDKADTVNLQAAETFPNDRRLFALMVRSLSPDIPGVELSGEEQKVLNKALLDLKK